MKIFKKTEQSFRENEGSAFYKKLKSIRNPVYKLLFFIALLASTALLYFTEIGCVWYHFFGIRCAGCGMSRALISLLKGDILLSLKYHFMLWSVPILFLYIIFDGKPFKSKRLNIVLLIFIMLGFAVRWLMWYI